MKRTSRVGAVIATVFALSAGTAVVSGVSAFRQAPLTDSLTEQFKDANKKLDSIKEQARKDTLSCVKSGGGVEACSTEEGRTIEEASKPVSELRNNVILARTRSMVSIDAMLVAGVISLVSGVLLLARMAFQKRREQQKAAQPARPLDELMNAIERPLNIPTNESQDSSKGA